MNGLSKLIDRRDAIWKRINAVPSSEVEPIELTKLVQANEAVETALNAPDCELRRDFSAHKVESLRCIVCRGVITSCEIETRHKLHHGNSAVLSAARLFIAAHEPAAA